MEVNVHGFLLEGEKKFGIDLSYWSEEQIKKFADIAEDFVYGQHIFLLGDKRFSNPKT